MSSSAAPIRQLSLFDAVCINVGIIIGAGIYQSTPFIASLVGGPWGLVGVWLFGGAVALVGAMCYGELTTAFPRQGGEYVFLSRAFGRRSGLMFAWCEFWIVRPGNIGFIALVGGNYAQQVLPAAYRPSSPLPFACVSIVVLTLVNVFGVRMAKWTQNVLATIKVGGLATIVLASFFLLDSAQTREQKSAKNAAESTTKISAGNGADAVPKAADDGSEGPTPQAPDLPAPAPQDFHLAMIFVLFAYGGWNEMSNVAAEIREPRKNLWLGLVLSAATVAAIYVLFNLASVRTLGYAGMIQSQAVAADIMELAFGSAGRVAISALICLSCLGAVNGYLFTGARLTYAMGSEHTIFAWLGGWNGKWGTPVRALVVQGIVTLIMAVACGADKDGFSRLITFTAPVFWYFFFMAGIALFVLRNQTAEPSSAQRVIAYPLTPILFCLSSAFMFWAGVEYALANRSVEGWWTIFVVVVGLLACLADRAMEGEKAHLPR